MKAPHACGLAALLLVLPACIPPFAPSDTRFPLRAASLQQAPPRAGQRPLFRWLVFQAASDGFAVYVRTGPRAGRHDLAAASAIVESIGFPPLRTGTVAPSGLYVLGRARDFGEGVTRLDRELPAHYRTSAPPLPLYLVHLGSGFRTYPARVTLGGGRRVCPIDFDRSSRRFRCRLTGAEWNVAGKLVRGRATSQVLERYPAPVAHDGHLLVPLVQTRLAR